MIHRSRCAGRFLARHGRAIGALLLVAAIGLPAWPAAAKQPTYATPEQAVDGLVTAARAGKTKDLLAILGPGSASLLQSGDTVADAQARRRFLAAYDEAKDLSREDENRAIFTVGKDDWPFPCRS